MLNSMTMHANVISRRNIAVQAGHTALAPSVVPQVPPVRKDLSVRGVQQVLRDFPV